MAEKFASRHIGVSKQEDIDLMLSTIGASSLDDLIEDVIPSTIHLKHPLALAEGGMSEHDFAQHIAGLAQENQQFRSFIGMGYYPCDVPAVVSRNVWENPAWYSAADTPQAEVAQGRLEALLNFQRAVTSLSGMEIASCSLLDEATATADAMLMLHGLRSGDATHEGRNQFFVDENIFPHTLDLLLTRSEPCGIELIIDSFESYEFSGREFGALVQYPAANGAVCDYSALAQRAHATGALVVAIADPLSLALLLSPGEWGADVVVGSAQRLGLPMGLGAPSVGYLATRERYKNNMPGDFVTISKDRCGNEALLLQSSKAAAGSSSALMAAMVGFYCVYKGAEGVREGATTAHLSARSVAASLQGIGYKLTCESFFDTIEVEAEAAVVQSLALEREINLYYPSEERVRLSFDQVTSEEEMQSIAEIFALAKGRKPRRVKMINEIGIDPELLRHSEILEWEVFKRYRSEGAMMRYIKNLELRDMPLAATQKLHAASIVQPTSLAGFQNIHPFAPEDQTSGFMALIAEIEHNLATITGFDGCSLQPNSSAAGTYAALMVIRAYHQSRGQGYRNIILIPEMADEICFTAAAMAAMKVTRVKCDKHGNIDIGDLKAKVDASSWELSAAIVSCPSAQGLFDSAIREVVDVVHDAGAQIYMTGNNMNALVGLTSPGYIAADICHLDLRTTFAMPHSGGAICCAEHLSEFLPSHSVAETGGANGITAVASAPWGSALLLPAIYGYIKMMGREGLCQATKIAILNANYIAAVLKEDFPILYSDQSGRVTNKLTLDLAQLKVRCGCGSDDVARRMIDYGFHLTTSSFTHSDSLEIEPTECMSLAEMDLFIEALRSINTECESTMNVGDNIICNAPHTSQEICSEWCHPYTRAEAAYPLQWVRAAKWFPYVAKINDGSDLCCRCQ